MGIAPRDTSWSGLSLLFYDQDGNLLIPRGQWMRAGENVFPWDDSIKYDYIFWFSRG